MARAAACGGGRFAFLAEYNGAWSGHRQPSTLERDDKNPLDPSAVKVLTQRGDQIGYKHQGARQPEASVTHGGGGPRWLLRLTRQRFNVAMLAETLRCLPG